MTEGSGSRFVGQRVQRREDPRFLTGRGKYVDDVTVPRMVHAAFVRSNLSCGQIAMVDVEAARALPGVVAVYTAAELNPFLVDVWTDLEGPPAAGAARVPFRPLADGDVRFVGEPIAVVLAESRYVAEDACELVEVDVDPEEPVIEMEDAVADGARLVHPELGTNVLVEHPPSPDAELDAAFAAADHVLTRTFRQHRYACVPMETRGIIADWDRARDQLDIRWSTQGPHVYRNFVARAVGLPENKVRVVMGDVGGGFGQKLMPMSDELAVVLASRLAGRPVKWIEDRRENLMSGQHAREDHATASFAFSAEGIVQAARVDFLSNSGSYPAPGSSGVGFSRLVFPGPYRIGHFAATGRAVLTNTAGRCSYRGPWMMETVTREQMMDAVARQLGIDPLDLRRRNVVRKDDLPYTTAAGMVYDSVSPAETLDQAAEMIGYEAFRIDQAEARAAGRLVGLGIGLYMEPSGMAGGAMASEAATVRMGVDGQVEVVSSSASHGQSTETTIAQVVADELAVDLEDVSVVQGDTATAPYGAGTGGSRSGVLISGAVREAAQRVASKLREVAAHELEADPADIELVDGTARVVGTPARALAFDALARTAYLRPDAMPEGMELGLEGSARYSPSSPITWSNSCHMCTVEIDRITGAVTILRYVVSEDCGVVINPDVVEGQVSGGVVQGIGGVLFEHVPYDEAGNPLATTFVDYLLPTAAEVPIIEHGHVVTPAPTNPGGHKGLGEGGAIGSPAALINAIADALAPLGITITDQPLGAGVIADLVATAGRVGSEVGAA